MEGNARPDVMVALIPGPETVPLTIGSATIVPELPWIAMGWFFDDGGAPRLRVAVKRYVNLKGGVAGAAVAARASRGEADVKENNAERRRALERVGRRMMNDITPQLRSSEDSKI